MVAPNVLDRAIGWFSPVRGQKRFEARVKLERSRAYYDGASRTYRTEGWRAPHTGPNREIIGSITDLRSRARDLVRNNPWAARGVGLVPNNAISYGISYGINHADAGVRSELEAVAAEHLEARLFDSGRRFDFFGQQHLGCRTLVEAGEVLLRRRWRRSRDSLPLPFQVQILEPDFLDTTKDGALQNGGWIVQGVEFSAIGNPVAYWLYPEHPGDRMVGRGFQSDRVPAQDIAHCYRMDRPGQVRGVPWLAPVIIASRDFSEYEDAQLLRQKIASAFVGIEVMPLDASDSSELTPLPRALEPGTLMQGTPGHEVKFSNPPSVDGYEEFARISLRKIAAGLQVPYEGLTGDLSNVNFSSGRMGWLEFQRSIEAWQWHTLIPGLCEPVMRWFLEAASVAGVRGAEGARIEWQPPRREMINPADEVPAIRDAIRAGLMTPGQAIREQGYNPRRHWDEYRDDLQAIEGLGIAMDPREPVTRADSPEPAPEPTENEMEPADG